MGSRRRYEALFVLILAAVSAAACVLYVQASAWGTHAGAWSRGASHVYITADPAAIRPVPEAFQSFATEDAHWRARNARWFRPDELVIPAAWSSGARDSVRELIGFAYRAGHLDQAIATLSGWIAAHPDDIGLSLELARLLTEAGRPGEAIAQYREILGRAPDRAIRRDLANLLLASSRYSEASREFSALAASEPADHDARLGWARALAWSGRADEAEPVVAMLVRQDPDDRAARALLQEVRQSVTPAPSRAARWVAEEPGRVEYRLAYARALAREGALRPAISQFDTVLAVRADRPTLLEAAGVRSRANDAAGAARLVGIAVSRHPGDTALRREYAQALTWAGDGLGAVEQYTILLGSAGWQADATILLRRGEALLGLGDWAGAERDLLLSSAITPTAAALTLLGDLYRWRGDTRTAREAYRLALARDRGSARALTGLQQLRHDEHLAIAARGPAPGWVATTEYVEDNAGYLFVAAGLERSTEILPGTTAGVAFQQRRISQRHRGEPERFLLGYSASATGSWTGPWWRLNARAGAVRHARVPLLPLGSATLQLGHRSVRFALGFDLAPAYTALMAPRAVLDWTDPAPVLQARTVSGALSAPLGSVDLWSSVEHTRLSDGNRSTTVRASARVPLSTSLSVLYSGTALGYSERSTRYWDPIRYTVHSAGLELGIRPFPYAGVTLRVMPGLGRTLELLPLPGGDAGRVGSGLFHVSASGEAWYRRRGWDIGANLFYNQGRDFGYRALGGGLRVRPPW